MNKTKGSRNVRIDLENWMGQLPEPLTRKPLIHLSIPGSHNSFSYSLSSDDGVSPDSPPFVQGVGKWCRPIANHFILNWSKGQKVDVTTQLRGGIRYYDVRLVLKGNEIVIAHGLYGGNIRGFLEQINYFLQYHPKEVVIVDFQHFYEFTSEYHEKVFSMLLHIFGRKVCQRHRRMQENTLRQLWDNNEQIIIIYRHQVNSYNDFYWPSGTWATPWPDKIKVGELIDYLNKGLASRREGIGYVSQGILTPTPQYVALHAFGSLRKLATRSNRKIISWVESKNSGAGGINVVICDFVEKFNFAERVVRLNYKGFEDSQNEYNTGVKDNVDSNYETNVLSRT